MSDSQIYSDSNQTPIPQVKSKKRIIEGFSKNILQNKSYRVLHIILAVFALYVNFRCNNGFEPFSFVAALCCPLFYVVYMLIVTNGKACIGNIMEPPSVAKVIDFEAGI